jgi:hypothetical protein
VKPYVHARLDPAERADLDRLKRRTGRSESQLVREGLRLVAEQAGEGRSALDLAGPLTGRFRKGPHDLSTNPAHLDGFGR